MKNFQFPKFPYSLKKEKKKKERDSMHDTWIGWSNLQLIQYSLVVSFRSFSVVCWQARQARKVQIHVGEIN